MCLCRVLIIDYVYHYWWPCTHAVSGVYCPGVWHRLVASVVLEHQPYPDWHQWAAGLVPELELDHKEAGTSWSQLAGGWCCPDVCVQQPQQQCNWIHNNRVLLNWQLDLDCIGSIKFSMITFNTAFILQLSLLVMLDYEIYGFWAMMYFRKHWCDVGSYVVWAHCYQCSVSVS